MAAGAHLFLKPPAPCSPAALAHRPTALLHQAAKALLPQAAPTQQLSMAGDSKAGLFLGGPGLL